MPYDHYRVTWWAWLSLVLSVLCLVPASISLWHLYLSSWHMQELDMRQSMVTGTADSNSMISSKSVRDRIKELRTKQGHFKYLLSVEPLTLIYATAFMFYMRLVTDVISWLYSCLSGNWDWFIVIIDSISLLIATVAAVMLLFVFIQRYYLVFDGSLSVDGGSTEDATDGGSNEDATDTASLESNPNTIRFAAIILLAAVASVFGLLMAVASFSLKWELVGAASVGFLLFLFSAASMTLWFYFQPMLHLANLSEMPSGYLLHATVRLTLVSAVALCSICLVYFWAAVAYSMCEECKMVYIYYNLYSIDAVINLQCLVWTLRTGQRSYFQWCACGHNCIVGRIEKSHGGDGTVARMAAQRYYLESASKSTSAVIAPVPDTEIDDFQTGVTLQIGTDI